MPQKAHEISTRWIRETRDAFREFLDKAYYSDPEWIGERGPDAPSLFREFNRHWHMNLVTSSNRVDQLGISKNRSWDNPPQAPEIIVFLVFG